MTLAAPPFDAELTGIRNREAVPGQIAFLASPTPLARATRERLIARYGDCEPARATVVVALGGDGGGLGLDQVANGGIGMDQLWRWRTHLPRN